MKKYIFLLSLVCCSYITSCTDLNMSSPSSGTSGNWYSTPTEVEMALNDLYKSAFWSRDKEEWADDLTVRNTLSSIQQGTLSSQSGDVSSLWNNQYKAIARANNVIINLDRLEKSGASQQEIQRFEAEARFFRATSYFKLIVKFGAVPYTTRILSIEEAFEVGRTSAEEIKNACYKDIDFAIETLPTTYAGAKRVTKGAALAIKARYALYLEDYEIAAQAAKECMDLNIYKLHPSFSEYFLQTTKNSVESILATPRSISQGIIDEAYVNDFISRLSGGYAFHDPSWDLLASFLCTDGLTIDKSPLFDPSDPFKNRDPRCAATIVPFGSEHLGFIYQPHPDSLEVLNVNTGKMVSNQDCRTIKQYASFNALIWKKGIDKTWLENGKKIEPDNVFIRYAEVLLIYAEAKIELDEIDQTVLDAMNLVRARAYGVDKSEIDRYPSITEENQEKLRHILRIERRMEFAKEGLRYMDLVRWQLAEIALKRKDYGIFYPTNDIDREVWFWPIAPTIDEMGIPDFSAMETTGKIQVLSQRNWDNRQYLWPIPFTETSINPNMTQNPGY